MRELVHDAFNEVLRKYDRLVVDYCLMMNDPCSRGYNAHKEAVLYAMERLRDRYPWFTVNPEKATAQGISPEELFFFPAGQKSENPQGMPPHHNMNTEGTRIPYWYAFVNPPHGTGPVIINGKKVRDRYGREDFELVNHALFPQSTDELEVYEWSTDWSDYFDAGKEWWGVICCSIYDKKMNRYVVLMASSTD